MTAHTLSRKKHDQVIANMRFLLEGDVAPDRTLSYIARKYVLSAADRAYMEGVIQKLLTELSK
jgi:hypothetical protein